MDTRVHGRLTYQQLPERVQSPSMPVSKSALGPGLCLHPGTLYETIPFNFKFANGLESFSFLVPTICHTVVRFLLERPGRDTKADLIQWACAHLGREWDLDRVSAFAMRTTAEGRIEVRLQFRAPWYLGDEPDGSRIGEGSGSTMDGQAKDGALPPDIG